MESPAVVEHLDVFEDGVSQLEAAAPALIVNELGVERGKEALAHRAVRAFSALAIAAACAGYLVWAVSYLLPR